jgi:hypothetical protein
MPHEMGYCDCGREIHFPCTARFGDKWRCYSYGRSWTLRPNGGVKPSYRVTSRRPPKPRVIVVQVAPPPRQNTFLPPGTTPLQALPAPRRRGGLLAWLLGE